MTLNIMVIDQGLILLHSTSFCRCWTFLVVHSDSIHLPAILSPKLQAYIHNKCIKITYIGMFHIIIIMVCMLENVSYVPLVASLS